MICISFNVRGFGGGPKFRALKKLFLNNIVNVYFIQETMNLGTKACELILRILKYWELCSLDVDGIYGGLVATWNPSTYSFKPFRACTRILLEGKFQGFEKYLHLLNVHAPYKDRRQFWDRLDVSGLLSLENLVILT